MARMIYDYEQCKVDLGARRATDMAHNQRVILPQPRSAVEEAILSSRLAVWKNVVD